MSLGSSFSEFISGISPTPTQRENAISGHRTLRERLQADPDLSSRIVAVFIQGSYRRATAVRPVNGTRSDVDLVVVTDLPRDRVTPSQALAYFRPFLRRHYHGKWATRGRSLGIELSRVDLDLVVTSAPSAAHLLRSEFTVDAIDERRASPAEAAAWKLEPLYIPNRETSRWEPTHPLAQIAWTREKNARCNGYFVHVVKAIKWWRRTQINLPKHMKSYPLEHVIGFCCPDGIRSVAEGITRTFETIAAGFRPFTMLEKKPALPAHGVPNQDVLARVPSSDFLAFVNAAQNAARLARGALSQLDPRVAALRWRALLGHPFPTP
ncbi:MAG: nucleotidyltransferase [Myxococcales bacterium]|nr:nucleotidyltransferase [Myxococcales bacterium]